ncbi:MAG: DUF4032 domain-containing protein [Nitriliruptorales bacterium]|nr:DUF4032 domain-containing protein [Nitriliruptorales bacterium]
MRIRTRPGHPDFLDLPWDQPLEGWTHERVMEVARGNHRHVVQFVDYDGALYALKELPSRLAEREYRMLRRMEEESLPAVDAVGTISRNGLEDVLVTRYLDYSLPYRVLFARVPHEEQDVRSLSERLLDALVMLLVRLHVAGFSWGDCSLNNTLFRRDAGALAAYVVDVETGEWHPELTPGQREADLEITVLNVAGGLMDLQAQLGLPSEPDPADVANDLRLRYEQLWRELTTDAVIDPGDRFAVESRIRRLNDLGFDVDEVEIVEEDGGDRLTMRALVAESGHHRRRLLSLTGLDAQENQARSLLNDLANFRAYHERLDGRPLPESVAAYRWLAEVFEPTVAAIPSEQRGKREAAEVFHEIIEHKWFLSERSGEDVGVDKALASYLETVLPEEPDERNVLRGEMAEGWISFG